MTDTHAPAAQTRGMSLIELLISLALGLIIIMVATYAFMTSTRIFDRVANNMAALQDMNGLKRQLDTFFIGIGSGYTLLRDPAPVNDPNYVPDEGDPSTLYITFNPHAHYDNTVHGPQIYEIGFVCNDAIPGNEAGVHEINSIPYAWFGNSDGETFLVNIRGFFDADEGAATVNKPHFFMNLGYYRLTSEIASAHIQGSEYPNYTSSLGGYAAWHSGCQKTVVEDWARVRIGLRPKIGDKPKYIEFLCLTGHRWHWPATHDCSFTR